MMRYTSSTPRAAAAALAVLMSVVTFALAVVVPTVVQPEADVRVVASGAAHVAVAGGERRS